MATKNPTKQPLPNGYISKGGHEAYDVHDNYQATSTYMNPSPKAFHVRVHANNDKFQPGTKMVVAVNKVKTFENFLDECTEKIKPPFGAARRLYTARGRHRIQRLEELEEDKVYVITGNESFKREINYRDIPSKVKAAHRRGPKKIDVDQTYTPVQHALEERLRKKSGRSYYLNEHRRGLRLRVHVNGYNEKPSCPVSIRYSDKDNFMKILQEIETTLNLQPIKKVYKVINQGGYAENFNEITDATGLQPDEHILVLPNNDHKLQVKFYSLEGKNNFKVTTSPRAGQYYLYPSFPTETTPFKHNKSLNKHKPLPSIGSSKQSEALSPLSNPPGSTGGRSVKNNKPKGAKQVDYDKDEGGVYRAKKQNNARGAQQERVNEDAAMHPIDEYDDSFNRYDQNASGGMTKDPRSSTPASRGEARRKQEQREHEAAAKIQAGARGYKARKEYKAKKEAMKVQEDARQREADNWTREEEERRQREAEARNHEAAQKQQKQMDEDMAASKIQAGFKGYKQRKEYNLKKQQVRESPKDIVQSQKMSDREAAVKIQSGFRGYKARKEYKDRKGNKEVENKETDINENEKKAYGDAEKEAAVKIQSGFRGYKVRKEYKARKKESKPDDVVETSGGKGKMNDENAAKTIQAGFRGYKTRKEYAKKKAGKSDTNVNKTDNDKHEAEAAKKIQASYRGYRVRKEYAGKKREKEEHNAATRIQASFRGYQERKKITGKTKEPQLPDQAPSPKGDIDQAELDKAATKIQSGFRGYKTRKEFKAKVMNEHVMETDHDQLPESAVSRVSVKKGQFIPGSRGDNASKIQSAFRFYKMKKNLDEGGDVLGTNRFAGKGEEKAKIVAAFRGYITRKTEKELLDKKHNAATKIQANYRGYRIRHTKFYPIRALNFFHAAVRGYITRKLNHIQTLARAKVMSVPNGGRYASVIQALCRGFLTRHAIKTRREKQGSATSQGPSFSEISDETKNEPRVEVTYWKDTNIKMYSDKTIRKAAARIQAAIYAHKTRESYQKLRLQKLGSNQNTVIEKIDANFNIQACFKGYLNRKREVSKVCEKKVEKANRESREKQNQRESNTAETGALGYKDSVEMLSNRDGSKPSRLVPTPPSASRPASARPRSRIVRPESGHLVSRPKSGKPDRPTSGRPVSGRPVSARPTSASGQSRPTSRPSSRPGSTVAQRGSSGKVQSQSSEAVDEKVGDEENIEVLDLDSNTLLKEGTMRSSTRLSGTANSLKSETLLSLSDIDKDRRKGSARSYSTWKSEKIKSSGGEVEREGESLREVEDDAGELSSIEKNVNAVGQLQAAFRAYRLRREISELLSGGAELMDIRNVDRAVSALKKDFRLRSAKVRRLGSLQFGRDKPQSPGQNWWETADDDETGGAKRQTGGDDSLTDSGSSKSDASPRENDLEDIAEQEQDDRSKFENESNSNRTQKPKPTTSARKQGPELDQTEARHQIEAAYRGYRTRMTENQINSTDSQSDGSTVVHRVRHERKLGSSSTARTVFHVQMHSDVINERCTQLQAAFAGYQTRKVFMSLTKLVEMSEYSDHNTSGQEFERMGSLSETDDFKLRHKSIAKIQAAYESYRIAHEAKTGQRQTFKGDQLPSVLNKHMVLPPIPQSIQVSHGSVSRPLSGVIRSELEVLPLPEGKSKTLPNLYHRGNHMQEKKLNNIEMYIRKKTAATILQSCARGFLTRLKFQKKLLEAHDSQLNVSNSSTGSEKSRRGKSPVSMGRKTPGSVASRASKVSFKTSSEESSKKKEHHTKSREDKTMSEIMRQRTASIKLEAERRKVIAEQIKLKQMNEAKAVQSGPAARELEKLENEQTKPSENSAIRITAKPKHTERHKSPPRLTPIPSSRLQSERDENRNELVQQEEQAAVTIQKVYRGYRTRQELEKEKPRVSEKMQVGQEYNKFYESQKIKPGNENGEPTLEVKKQLDNEYVAWKRERNDAAVAIQSVWRGYAIRKGKLQPEEMIKEDFSHLSDDRGLIVINIGRSKSEIDRANRLYDNASMIQMIFRACKIRRKLAIKASKRRYEKNKAASKIQGLYQGFLTRFKLKESKSATRIQSIFKAYLARDNMLERERNKEEQRQKAASRLQAAYMSFQKRRENEALKEERALNKAASEIQIVTKGFMSRWEGARRKEHRELVAANTIHAAIRGYRERVKNKQWRQAGEIIMAGFKSYKVRQEVQAYKDKLARERKAATRLQAAYRAYLVRTSNRDYKEKMARQNKAATKIQCCIKGRNARIAYKKHKEMVERQRQTAAIQIQAAYRGHQGRRIARKEREIHDMHQIAEDMINLVINRSMDYVRRRNKSAERIQATVKGFNTRRQMTIKLCDEARLRNRNATIIRTAFRALALRKRVARQKQMASRKNQRQVVATIIQAVVRAKQIRNQQEKRKLDALMNEAAIKIQAVYRGYHTRKEIEKEKEMIASIEPPPTAMISARTLSGRLLRIPIDDMLLRNSRAIILFHRKATDLQAAFSGYITREEMKGRYVRKTTVAKQTPRRVLSVTKQLTAEDKAAILIQKTFRGYWDRKVYQTARNLRKKKLNIAATNIQAAVKGYRVRLEENLKRVHMREAGLGEVWRQKQESANIISCAFRSLKSRNAKRALRAEM